MIPTLPHTFEAGFSKFARYCKHCGRAADDPIHSGPSQIETRDAGEAA